MGEASSWIARTEDLAEVAASVGAGPLAVDTEADSFHHYREKICLVQLSFGGVDRLVDTLAGIELAPLRPILADRSVRKILHGADYDLRLLGRDHELRVEGLYDTMVAARLAGERSFGLAALLERHLGLTVDKKLQRADWSIRPLPEPMIAYALLDTRHLERLAEILDVQLARLGRREWAAEEFARLERVCASAEARSEAEPFRRVKRSGALDRRGLAVLRELCSARDELARARDVPLFRVANDELLVRLADGAARGRMDALGLPPSWSAGRVRRFREAIARGLAEPTARLPELAPRRAPRMAPERERRLRELKAERDRLALALGIEASVLAPHALLERALEEVERGADPERLPEMRRWQGELLRPLLAR